MSFFQSLMQFDVALRTGFRYVSNKRRNPNVTSVLQSFLFLNFTSALLHIDLCNNQLIIFSARLPKETLDLALPWCIRSLCNFLPIAAYSRSSLRTGFRYNFLPIAACSQILLAYWIPVQLSSDRRLFPDPPCVPDSVRFQ